MSDSQYRLTSEQEPKKRSLLKEKVVSALAATALLIGAAVFGPGLLQASRAAAQETVLAQASPAQQIDSSLVADQEALADMYERVAKSVVNIRVTVPADVSGIPFGLPQGDLPFQQGQGSGFIYDNEGHIVTNNHVIEGAEKVTVVFNDGTWAEAEVVASDPQADLGVVKVTPPEGFDWQPLPLDNDGTLRVGHHVIAIGNPFGLAGTMTTGIVSAIGRGFPVGGGVSANYTLPDVIQTDAAINPGNSGGPLMDLQGEVVGVNFAIESATRSNSGVGFAIPVSIVKRVVPALIADGAYKYAYVGLSGTSITPELAQEIDLPNTLTGVYVAQVVPGGPAEEAGLKGGNRTVQTDQGQEVQVGGDIIVGIEDRPVRRFEDLVSYLVTQASPGDVVTLDVLRDGEQMQVEVTLGERPAQTAASDLTPGEGGVSARQAIQIAEQAVQEGGLLEGEIQEKVASPDTFNGQDVWIVELSDGSQTATAVVDKASGEVLQLSVK